MLAFVLLAALFAGSGLQAAELLPFPVVFQCLGKVAGDACSVTMAKRSFDGVCTTLPFSSALACLPPQPPTACAACGDGVVTAAAGEQCDPGSAAFTASCNINCTLSACGDGIVNPAAGEQCDPGAPGVNTSFCNANCTIARCGDGIVNSAAGEQCDTGGFSQTCNANCTIARCGDGIVNRVAGEECDDGQGSSFCNPDCTVRR
jgi:hypothetical protein